MIIFKPIQLALWLFIGCISFGIALNLGWLIVLGLLLPIGLLVGFLLCQLL